MKLSLPKSANLINVFLVFVLNLIPKFLIRRLLVVIQAHPSIADNWGYFVRPIHYYEPLPDFSQITVEQVLTRRSFNHINFNWTLQFNYIERLKKYSKEIQDIANGIDSNTTFDFYNNAYGELDAAIYYALIREIKPLKLVEIGSGYSTFIASLAIEKNAQQGNTGFLTCIEPYPPQYLEDSQLNIELIQTKIEDIHLDYFDQLQSGDILFIDSTHTVKYGGDCIREILDILPQLPKGVFVHIHDIFFPYDYPPQWIIEERRAWNEQYLLEAFLAYNSSFEIILANNYLTIDYPGKVAEIWTNLLNSKNTHSAGGFWIRKV